MLKELDAKIQKYLIAARNRGVVINTNISIATANGFLKHSNDESMNHVSLGSPWAPSLFRCKEFARRFATTGKVEIPEGVKREAELLYVNNILNLIETHNIPKSMVLNHYQTPLRYVLSGNTTLAPKSSSTVPIKGVSHKRMIAGTFTISLDVQYLPIQLIYAGKTHRSIPKVNFPKEFSLSANPKHFSSTVSEVTTRYHHSVYTKGKRTTRAGYFSSSSVDIGCTHGSNNHYYQEFTRI